MGLVAAKAADLVFYIFSHPNALGNVTTRMTDITEMRNPTDPFAERPEISASLKAKLRAG